MNQLIISAASLAAVGVLVGLAFLLGFRDRLIVDEAVIRSQVLVYAAENDIVCIRIDRRGRAGLAQLADGRIVTVAAVGDRIAARLWRAKDVQFEFAKRGVKVRLPDVGYPMLFLEEVGP
jgi:hypothetical protein